MEMTPQILFAKVMHKRLLPKVNAFLYSLYYIVIPVEDIELAPLPIDRPGLLSFYRKDHGARDGSDLKEWILSILHPKSISADGGILLLTMPRVLGYVFNPVSFWLCFDIEKNLSAVLCEVNNTFGETHSYLCAHTNGEKITSDQWIVGEKSFHVSPFLEREGYYRFRFQTQNDGFGAWIDYYDKNDNLTLATTLTGRLQPMTKKLLRKAFWRYPLVTIKAILLIHWQAIKLLIKGIRYLHKPIQNKDKITVARNIKNL